MYLKKKKKGETDVPSTGIKSKRVIKLSKNV